MIRSLNDVLTSNQNHTEIVNILKSPDLEKEKFILALKLIYNTKRVENGFTLLKSIQRLDTSAVIDQSFVEELLNPDSNYQRNINFDITIKILDIILKNASHKENFEMAIHQNLMQYSQKATVDTSKLEEIFGVLKLIVDHLNSDKMTSELLQTMCTFIVTRLSQVAAEREADLIRLQNMDRIKFVEFFRSLQQWPQINFEGVADAVLNRVYILISIPSDMPSSLITLGLSIIPEQHIGTAVVHLLKANRSNSPETQIKVVIKRLVNWIRETGNIVPIHIWIQKILHALYHEGWYDLLNDIVLENIIPVWLTMLLPMYQKNTSIVIQAMLEVQKSEEVLKKSVERFLLVIPKIESNPEVFHAMLDSYADYLSCFANADVLCRDAVEYLASHQRIVSRSAIKQRRLTSLGAFGGNARVGLENLGNSCYINSVIQALFMAKSFCRDLLTIGQPDRETLTMQKIFALLLFSNRSELNIRFAMQNIRPHYFMPGLQHDSSEFMGSLLDKLHEADKKTLNESGQFEGEGNKETEEGAKSVDDSGVEDDVNMEATDKIVDNTSNLNESSIVQRNFGGKISTTCVCSSCKSKSISIDSFRDLALSFPEKGDNWNADSETEFSVQQLLDFYFTTEQLTLDGDNQYHCEKCKSLCDGFRCTELLQPPKNLILTLKHFRYDSRHHTRSKLLIKKMFHDEKINVKVRTSHDAGSVRTVQYQLHAAVVHSGVSLDSGHYYTFARENESVWYKFNDSYVSTSTLQELHNLHSPNTPYILFYQRISTASSTVSSAECSAALQTNDEKLPNLEDLPPFLRKFVIDDNAAYEKETKKFFAQNKSVLKTNSWNDDDPPSSCGSNYGIQPNRFIY